ncbi:MAG TPA: glycine cleavage system protein H [Thermoanaerobaculia bacterium]|nr:glycine cleavage system protein H [Thermoanaerobaculia bacterium]
MEADPDFAARVAGGVSRIDVPARGQWIRQGQKIIAMQKDGFELDLVSPIEGTVVDVNDAVLTDPNVTRADPYGHGWLLKVNSPDAKTNFRNLLEGNVARRWMEDAAGRLRGLIAAPKLVTAHDGGVAADDLLGLLPAAERENAVRELFLIA